MNVYPDTFIFVQYHMFDEYSTPWSDDRWAFYNAAYTPTAIFDGADLVEGAVHDIDQQYNIYRVNHFLPRQAQTTDVTIDLSAEQVVDETYTIFADVGIEAGGTGKTMRIYMVQVLDHWPDSPSYSRNTFMQAAPTQDITLAPGESQIVEHEFTFDAESWSKYTNIKVVAWAQPPSDTGPIEVYQAATRAWNLEAYANDEDGDGELDSVDNCPTRFNPDQADGDGDDIGDVCDNCIGVMNTDQADADKDFIGDACDNCPSLHHLNQADTDNDEVGDVCDWCPEVIAPAGVHPDGRSLGTIDLDCDVDADDEVLFDACHNGPGVTTPPPGCAPEDFARSDLDGDGDVDTDDDVIFDANFTGPLIGPALYTGKNACVECHADKHTSWIETIHATAFDTLVASGDDNNPLCFPCHAVGYGTASGFVDQATTPDLANVQCENCHGPGSIHVADPVNIIGVNMDASLCGACHQSCHGLCGEDHHPQYEQWQTSTHSTALTDIQGEPDFADECLQCHSTDYRLAPEGFKPTIAEAEYDLECVACHNPHGTAYVGQLRLPPYLLCADCHTTGEVLPGEEPTQPQTEALHGFGGFELDGTPMDGPYTEHWWGIANECATCHVYTQNYGGPDQPVDSGHTFQSNMRACAPCHTEEAATLLTADVQEEIEARLDLIASYLNPADPWYLDPDTLTPQERAQYDVAVFNYAFVIADKSFGAHNALYTRALLAEAELFFEISPWLLRPVKEVRPRPADRDPKTVIPPERRP